MVLPGQKPRGVYKRRCIVALLSVCLSVLFVRSFLSILSFSSSSSSIHSRARIHNTHTHTQIGLYHLTVLLTLELFDWVLSLTSGSSSSTNSRLLASFRSKERDRFLFYFFDGFLFLSHKTFFSLSSFLDVFIYSPRSHSAHWLLDILTRWHQWISVVRSDWKESNTRPKKKFIIKKCIINKAWCGTTWF